MNSTIKVVRVTSCGMETVIVAFLLFLLLPKLIGSRFTVQRLYLLEPAFNIWTPVAFTADSAEKHELRGIRYDSFGSVGDLAKKTEHSRYFLML
ncbi:MAG: hypothetical protein R6U38_17435 [Desulfatiglandaceae bacterium]